MADRLLFTALSALEGGHWDELSRDRPQLHRLVLREFAAQSGNALQACLLVDDTGPLCGAVVEMSTAPTAAGRLEGLLFGRGRDAARRLGLVGLPYLCVAPPLGQDSGVIVRAGSEAERRAHLERFLVALERWCDEARAGLVFLSVPEQEQPLYELLRNRRSYLSSRSRSSTVLPIRWRDFDDYRRDLASRGGRIGETVRNERSRNRRAGVVIQRVTPTREAAARLFELAQDHYRYKNGEPLYYESAFLENLLPALGEDLLMLEARRDGEVCAMAGIVRSGSTGWASFFGLNTRDRPNDFTYFNLVYYSVIDHAAEFGVDRVIMGSGVYAAKLRRGCELVPIRFYHRPRSGLRRLLLRPWYALHARWVAKKFT